MSDDIMKYMTDLHSKNELKGLLIDVTYMEKTPKNDKGKCALRHPRFSKIRTDKNEADKL